MAERKVLLDNLPQDASPSVVRLINMYSPVKSLQTLSADSDLTLAQVQISIDSNLNICNMVLL